jgi:energy-coupling factor transport system ATP-binding protein
MITFRNVSYTYPDAERPVLTDLSLHIEPEEFVLVTGPSGAGKSTFLRCLNGLVPHFTGGTLSGKILVNGENPTTASPRIMSRTVGFVFQDPETQFVMDYMEDEIAFALENSAVPPGEIRTRIEETMKYMDIWDLRERGLHELSGGERQKAAIASALVMKPTILALDEPTSQLDPKAAEEVLDLLLRLRRDHHLTIVLIEHRLERVLPYADRMIYFPSNGSPVLNGKPETVLGKMSEVPPVVALGKVLGWDPLPMDVEAGKLRLSRVPQYIVKGNGNHRKNGSGKNGSTPGKNGKNSSESIFEVHDLSVSLQGNRVVEEASLQLFQGEILALVGHNGAGKTTLLRSMVGLQKFNSGNVFFKGLNTVKLEVAELCRQVGFLPQDPNALLFSEEVREELQITLRNHNLPEAQDLIDQILRQVNLYEFSSAYPRDLSTGQRQRVALAALLITQPLCLLLDEPTRGLDPHTKDELALLLQDLASKGAGILLVTHDVELVAKVANRVAVMQAGRIVAQGDPFSVLSSYPDFSPQILRLAPQAGQLTVDGLLAELGTNN